MPSFHISNHLSITSGFLSCLRLERSLHVLQQALWMAAPMELCTYDAICTYDASSLEYEAHNLPWPRALHLQRR